MSVEVRRVRPDEYDATGVITRNGYRVDGLLVRADGQPDRAYEALLLDVATRDRDAIVLVAEAGGTLLGTVTWCPPGSPWRELAQRPDQAEFRMLSVAPAGRGRGVGRALVQACVDRATAERMSEMVLSSLPEMTAAHRLYESFGFTRAPELDHSPKPLVRLWGYRLQLSRSP